MKDLLSTTVENEQPDSIIQAQIAEIRMTLPSQSGKILKQNPVVAGLSSEDDAINNQLLQGDCLGAGNLAHPEMAQACAIASMEENADAEDTLDSIMETDVAMIGGNGTPHTPPIATARTTSSTVGKQGIEPTRAEDVILPLITPVKDREEEKNHSDMTTAASKCGCFNGKKCFAHDKDLMLAPTSPPRNPATIISPLHPITPQTELRQRIPSTTATSPPHTPMTTSTTTNTFSTGTPYATPHTAPPTPDTTNNATTTNTNQATPIRPPQAPAPAAAAPVVVGGLGRRQGNAQQGAEAARMEEQGMKMVDALILILIGRILYIVYGIFMRNYLLHHSSSPS